MTTPPDHDDTSGPGKSAMSPAAYQRRYRDRKKQGVEVHRIEAAPVVKKWFVKIGWLTEAESQDRRRVAAGIENLIDCLARGTIDLEKLLAAIKDRDDCQKRGVFRPVEAITTGTATS